jgi:predicted aspartyl protease
VSIEFPLARKQTPFGPVSDPKIPVVVRLATRDVVYRFLIDTGADFSLAPQWLGLQIGLDWASLPETRVRGVEQRGLTARLGYLPIRIGDTELTIRCLFADTPAAPFILGRADFLDRFVLTVDHSRQTIVLTEIQ